ncbi:hypothetical protein C9925_01265 [cyanobacterium G8-9]|nr:hypothetical protein C9925_01265 [cyanobacterium G8-9]
MRAILSLISSTLSQKELEILKTIYNEGITKANSKSYINAIELSTAKRFNYSQIRSILDGLIKKGLIIVDILDSYDTSVKGREVMASLFDEN